MNKKNLEIVVKNLRKQKVKNNPFPYILIKNFIPKRLFLNFKKHSLRIMIWREKIFLYKANLNQKGLFFIDHNYFKS